MRTTTTLVQSPAFDIRSVACAGQHADWSTPEMTAVVEVVLVRQGRFRVRAGGRCSTVDPTVGYLHPAGHETAFAHPAGGDLCTAITVPGDAFAAAVDPSHTRAVQVDARLEFAHRRLLRREADADYTAAEAVVHLLQLALRRQPDDTPAPGRYDLADRAREAILAGDPGSASLLMLADLLETTPAHLSRTFRHHTGQSLSRYRNRVRISRSLQCIDAGETDLAGLAASLGFSDQAHFTRTMRAELGRTPGRVRELLTGSGAARPEPGGTRASLSCIT